MCHTVIWGISVCDFCEILDFETYFSWCHTALFFHSIKPDTLVLFQDYISTNYKLMIKKRVHACVCSVSEREKNHSPSLMMPTQRQWGAALISVTCPCASHQLHYGSISHASSANWIAREVVTRTGARTTSVPLLLQKWEESFQERHELWKHKPL